MKIIGIIFIVLFSIMCIAASPVYINVDHGKIDSRTTDGLLGTNNSLAYRVHEIEKHFHSPERRLSKKGTQTATDWADEDTLTAYRAISGSGVYGAGATDEALVIGTDDGPYVTGNVKFDLHRIFITALSNDTPFAVRIVWGTGTMDDAVTDGQYSHFVVQNNPTGNKAGGAPIDVMMPRRTWGTDKVWIQVMNATDNATMDFFVLVHGYAG